MTLTDAVRIVADGRGYFYRAAAPAVLYTVEQPGGGPGPGAGLISGRERGHAMSAAFHPMLADVLADDWHAVTRRMSHAAVCPVCRQWWPVADGIVTRHHGCRGGGTPVRWRIVDTWNGGAGGRVLRFVSLASGNDGHNQCFEWFHLHTPFSFHEATTRQGYEVEAFIEGPNGEVFGG